MHRLAAFPIVPFALLLPSLAVPGAHGADNPGARLALGLRSPDIAETCTQLSDQYASCADIVFEQAAAGPFRAAVVLHNVRSVRALEFGILRPPGWEISFQSCGELLIGGDVRLNPTPVAIAWGAPRWVAGSEGLVVAVIEGYAPFPGCLELVDTAPGETGGFDVLDVSFLLDRIVEGAPACAGLPAPVDPCAFDSVLIAAFSAEPPVGPAPLAVQFRDRSLGAPDAWLWDFGDGATSVEREPSHLYTTCGVYDVSLRVSSGAAVDDTTLAGGVRARSPLAADFTWSPAEGCPPLAVQFQDASRGSTPVSWRWTFGDGAVSTLRDPSHTYAAPGTYDVTLQVSDACTTASLARPAAVVVRPGPVVEFTAEPTSACAPAPVAFRDLTGGRPTAWRWDFGDGGTSDEPDPVHLYTAAGLYTVTLAVTDECTTATRVAPDFIHIQRRLPVDFAAEPTEGCAPLPVQFTDLTEPGATSWLWDFGDGATSGERNPGHAYAAPGDYDVRLTVTAACGPATLLREAAVRVTGFPPAGSFLVEGGSGCVPLDVRFHQQFDSTAVGWHWEFGDGGTSDEPDPVHRYEAAGLYDVSLTATSACGFTRVSEAGAVRASGAPGVDFRATPDRLCAPGTVQFTDLSVPEATSWLWDFGDGTMSGERNPAHLYLPGGPYDVTLAAANDCGSGELARPDAVRADSPPVPAFAAVRDTICARKVLYFDNFTEGEVTSWRWQFGDGGVMISPGPVRRGWHVYASPGIYDVSLTAFSSCGDSTVTRPDHVTVVARLDPSCRNTADGPGLALASARPGGGVLVEWTPEPRAGAAEYVVTRSRSLDGPFEPLHEGRLPAGAAGMDGTHRFLDAGARAGEGWHYLIRAYEASGRVTEYVIPAEQEGEEYPALPRPASGDRLAAWLSAPRPLPAAAGVEFELSLPSGAGEAELALFDSTGRRRALLFRGPAASAPGAVAWDARDERGAPLAPGIYFARLSAGGRTVVRKVVLAP